LLAEPQFGWETAVRGAGAEEQADATYFIPLLLLQGPGGNDQRHVSHVSPAGHQMALAALAATGTKCRQVALWHDSNALEKTAGFVPH